MKIFVCYCFLINFFSLAASTKKGDVLDREPHEVKTGIFFILCVAFYFI